MTFSSLSTCSERIAVPSGGTSLFEPGLRKLNDVHLAFNHNCTILFANKALSLALQTKDFTSFLKIGVSPVLMYFGSSLVMVRALKAITWPRTLRIGNISRLRKKSYGSLPFFPSLCRPASIKYLVLAEPKISGKDCASCQERNQSRIFQ